MVASVLIVLDNGPTKAYSREGDRWRLELITPIGPKPGGVWGREEVLADVFDSLYGDVPFS